MGEEKTLTAFLGGSVVAAGSLEEVITALKARFDRDPGEGFLIFDDVTGRQLDFDFRGPLEHVLTRSAPEPPRTGPGRPKLGVVAREVSLLPRHWEWLEQQPSGASAALRRLVDEARNREPGEQRARLAIEAASRFLTAVAGNLPGYEEVMRVLYGRNWAQFEVLIGDWPADIQSYARRLLSEAFAPEAG